MIDRRRMMACGLAGAAGLAAGASCSGKKGPDLYKPGPDEILAEPDALRNELRDRARDVFDQNRVESSIGLFHMPSAATYRSFFAWDSGWHVIALTHIDPELAYRELKTIFASQAEDGRVPHEVRAPELKERSVVRMAVIAAVSRQYDQMGRSMFIDPPSFLIAAGLLYDKTADKRVLDLIPAMDRCAEYLTGPRDLFGDGLVSIVHPWESGTDSAPVFDAPLNININSPLAPLKYLRTYPAMLNHLDSIDWDLKRVAEENRFVFEDVGMNAITAAGIIALSGLHAAAGRHDDAARWQGKGAAMVRAMEAVMWDEKEGFFFPRYDLENPRLSRRRCMTGVAPLITGLVDEQRAERVIDGALLSPDHFAAPWPVAFNSESELAAENVAFAEMNLWRGRCVWINMNWMAARAAAACGRADAAREITRRTAAMISREGFFEFYEPSSGAGMGAPGFTWPALVLDMIETHGL